MKLPKREFEIGDTVEVVDGDEPVHVGLITGLQLNRDYWGKPYWYYFVSNDFNLENDYFQTGALHKCDPAKVIGTIYADKWAKALEWAETHCWSCEQEIGRDWQDGDKCPECGVDLVPF